MAGRFAPAPAGEAARDTVAESRLSRMSGPGTARRRPRPPAQVWAASPASFLGNAGVERISTPAPGAYPLIVMQDPDPANQLTFDELRAELIKMPWLRKWFARKMLELDGAQ